MKGTNILREKINSSKVNLECQKFEDIVEIFINSLYRETKGAGHAIRAIIPEDENFKEFISINESLVYKYANNIKKDYDYKLLDPESEYANIYLYIIESLYLFFRKHCNKDIELFKSYIEDSNNTYVNSKNVEYTFSNFMYMSVERMIKEENKLHEKSLEKGCMNESDRFARIDLDATEETEEGKDKEIELYSMGLYTLIQEEDSRSEEQILKDNIKEMKRIQEKLSTVLTKSQVEFITTETYGCYFDIKLNDFVMKEYTKQQRNQFFNQISKRINRDIKPFFIKKHNKRYVEEMIKYRRKNIKKLKATSIKKGDYINTQSIFRVSNIKINN
ncbi:MAG: hypothetical protein PUJ51_21345 [Clostridiales bacterium]|uniref:hypothetical protein n=1 Tax=Terrisporobacter sp. TaxID=1965305 RepID=UPI002A4EB658|nr:hypothetical protein [Terrisporobacter sp.]MDD7757000.1 hypothetical protein [Clostridiales bacterium]MDY4137549.1 hypothetical protein [Terrisporobacter sp.]MDY4737068.1 hypothetical protein [Terrisporobacter sp.]